MSALQHNASDVLIVGGGVIGLSIALELLSGGATVVHVFPTAGDINSASRAAGAMLGAFGEISADDGAVEMEEMEFRLAAQRSYPAWLQRIRELSNASIFEAKGTFVVANNQGVRDRECIQHMKKEADARSEPAQWVEPAEIPGLSPSPAYAPSLCLYLGNEHSVHAGELMDGIAVALSRQPAYRRIDAEAVKLEPLGDIWRAALSNGALVESAAVVLAGGSRATECLGKELAGAAGLPKLYFGKGVSCVLSDAPALPHTIRTPIRAFACGIHVVPRPKHGELYLGATNFLGESHEAEGKVQPGELHSLFDEAIHQINTHIRTSRIESIRVGFRPVTAFRRPAVGRTKLPNLFIATGTYRNGVLMAPLIGAVIARDMNIAASLSVKANPFALTQEVAPGSDEIRRLLDVGVRDLVAFLQEPRGYLPFNRGAELESYLRGLLDATLSDDASSIELRELIRRRIAQAPFNETIHKLFYEIGAAAAKNSGR